MTSFIGGWTEAGYPLRTIGLAQINDIQPKDGWPGIISNNKNQGKGDNGKGKGWRKKGKMVVRKQQSSK